MVRKAAFIILVIVFTSFSVIGQDDCRRKLNDSNIFFSLRLEMTMAEVQSVFGRDLKVKVARKGEGGFFQNFIKKPAPAKLSGVRALYLRFLDRRLYQIEVFYENKPEWQTLQNLTNSFSAKLSLPNNTWTVANGKAEIKCEDLTLIADNVLNPRLELTNETTRTQILAAREKAKK